MAAGGDSMAKFEHMFDNKNEDGIVLDDGDFDPKKGGAKKGGSKTGKRLSVERIYQKKTQLEHILLRPDTYIGSVEKVTLPMWTMNEEANQMEQRDVCYVPGLYKIFDEIVVNAADNKQRDPKMTTLKIDIDPENCKIKIWNNGKGIPVAMHQTEKMYVPSLIFGVLLTSSNYNDDEKKVTGGRNGFGAKLCNVFSNKFTVETQCNEFKKSYRQTWSENMSKSTEPKIGECRGEDFTCITFYPDLSKFKMESLDKDIVDIFTRRAYDIAASVRGIKVILNGKRIPVKDFKEYCQLFLKKEQDEDENPVKLVFEQVSPRWEIGISLSEKGFQSASFVNSIATTKGGRHVDYITDQMVSKLIEVIKKKEKKSGVVIKPFQVKNHLWIFVNALIENPAFDSQTKENMTTQAKNFGSKCQLSDKFIREMTRSGIVEAIQTWMRFKATAQLDKKSGTKTTKLKNVPKLDDANHAGTKHSLDCTLILTEGDSAKTLAVAGLQIVGRDRYGVFPLKGKVLNVREASHKQIMDNAEITNLLKIIGLKYKEKYDTPESMKALRYGKIMIMTDQDQDGSHIKGLLINFVHHNWPNLLKHGFLEEFITPIVKATKKNLPERSFYSIPEFEEWKAETSNWQTFKIKYYKGLGTSTAKEAKEYFSDMVRHKILFDYQGCEDDASILLAFSKKKVDERKEWLTNWMEERKRRSQLGLPELYLYGKNTKAISFNEFVNRELILFSNMDNERSIPSLVDGLKPGQRKVMFTCFKRKLNKELKVAQLAGSVAELSAYHHGEVSLMGTIIGLAQNYVGSNNINLLQPIGQFGTRLTGGKDAASPRYIFTALSPLARILFDVKDDPLLRNLLDDAQVIEPEWYCPIIPMVLVNGAQGIGTGWSTNIPNHDPREIVRNIKRMLEGRSPEPMMPWFKNFRGTIEQVDGHRYVVNGEIGVTETGEIEITELPIRTWTQGYKDSTLEPMRDPKDKSPALIEDYKEYHTDVTVKFIVRMNAAKLEQAEEQGMHKVFKLQSSMATSSMVLFDQAGCIKRYDNVLDILQEFYTLRLNYYQKRKDCLEGMLSAESLKMDNIARFICEKIDGVVIVENKPKKELIQTLKRRGYDSDPIKAWKEANQLNKEAAESQAESQEEEEEEEEADKATDYNYLLGMPLWNLTKEKKDALLKDRDEKAEELYQLRKKSKEDLWLDDLNHFITELDNVEEKERKDAQIQITSTVKGAKGRQRVKKHSLEDTQPSAMARRIEPTIDAAMRSKIEAIAIRARKKKVAKKEQSDMLFDEDDEDDLKLSLADRVAAKKGIKRDDPNLSALSPVEKAAKKGRKPSGVKRERKLPGAAVKKGKSPKKGKKRNPWSSSDSDMDSMSDMSDGEDYKASSSQASPSRAPPRRTAAAKAKYNYDTDEEEKETSDSDNDPDAPPKKMSNGAAAKDQDSEEAMPTQSPSTQSPRSLSPPRRNDSSDEDFGTTTQSTQDDIFGTQSSNRPKSPIFSVDDSDEDPWPPRETETKVDAPKKDPPKKAPSKIVKKDAPKKEKAAKKTKSIKPDPKQPTLLALAKNKPKGAKFDADSTEDDELVIDISEDDDMSSVASKSKSKNPSNGKESVKPDPKQPTLLALAKNKPKGAKFDADSTEDDELVIDISEDDDEMSSVASKSKSKNPSNGKASDGPKKAPAKRKPKFSDLSDLSEDDDKPKPKKAPGPKKPRAAPKPKKVLKKGSDSEDGWEEPQPKKKSTAAKKKKIDDSDDDIEFEEVAAPSRGGGRARKAVKYNFGAEEEEEEDDDFY